MIAPTDDTLHRLQQSVIEAEKLSRYYHCLGRRLARLNELLSIVIIITSFAGIIVMLNSFPNWITALIFSLAAAASIVKVFGHFEERTAYSGTLHSQMQSIASEWLILYTNSHLHSNDDLRASWRKLTHRQRIALLYARADLPLSKRLMERCRCDAEQFWSMHHHSDDAPDAAEPLYSSRARVADEPSHPHAN